MKIIYRLLIAVSVVFLLSYCGGNGDSSEDAPPPESMVEGGENTESSGDESGTSGGAEDWKNNKGIGPVENLELGPIDESMAEEGKKVYETYCTACHKPAEKFIGPAPKDILERRTPEWVMNMILNPEEMVKKDPIAKKLLIEYNMAPMANQGLTREEARQILEYFRTL